MKLSRLLAAPVIAAAMLLAQLVSPGPAQAAIGPKCLHDDGRSYNACLTISGTGELNQWRVTAGLDAIMSQRYAQEIIDDGANLRATLWGDDGGSRKLIGSLPVAPGWPVAGPSGLSVELSGLVYGGDLNEDNGLDEIYAEITYFDFHRGRNIPHRTGTVVGEFIPWVETPCDIVCP